jgi:hypothetical protein
VRRALAQRQVVLGAVTLLAITVSFAVTAQHDRKAAAALPRPVGSYSALVAASGPRAIGKKTACGIVVAPRTLGISSPVLPCGTRLYLNYGTRHVLAPVVSRGPEATGAEFAVTPALARRLRLTGVKRVRWSYSAEG